MEKEEDSSNLSLHGGTHAFLNEGCKYTWGLPQQTGVFDGPSVYETLLVGLSALWE